MILTLPAHPDTPTFGRLLLNVLAFKFYCGYYDCADFVFRLFFLCLFCLQCKILTDDRDQYCRGFVNQYACQP